MDSNILEYLIKNNYIVPLDAPNANKTLPDPGNQMDTIKFLQQYNHLNFVQRLLNPYIFPVMEFPKGDPAGDFGTHLMSSGEMDGKGIVFPQIIQDPKTGKLERLGMRDAMNHAIKTREYLPFNTPEEADDFGTNYKKYLKIWGY
jgi:hypothetical protein